MKPIYITGLGILSTLGLTAEEVWHNLISKSYPSLCNPFLIPDTIIAPAKKRRMNRYSLLCLYTAIMAKEDALDKSALPEDPHSIGTIYTTGYGPTVTRLEFGEAVLTKSPDLCSPITFAGTVPNSCVGHVCMNLKCKGISTVLYGGNPFSISSIYLKNGKADAIYTGAVEEYCKDLFASIHRNPFSNHTKISECSTSFLLRSGSFTSDQYYCKIGPSIQADLGGYPLIEQIHCKDAQITIKHALQELIHKSSTPIDLVFTSTNGTYFDEIEHSILSDLLPCCSYVENVKKLFGETLGSSFCLNVAISALCLKHNCIPTQLQASKSKSVQTILVTGYDPVGNYMAMILYK